MKTLIALLLTLCSSASWATETMHEQAREEITKTLHTFMEGASINSAAIHEAFWADELVYTSSSGKRFGKAELMSGVHASGEITEQPLTSYYTAEDVEIRFFGPTAVVNFTLVAHTDTNAGYSRQTFLNSGVFVQRDNRWQAVNWNATRTAESSTE
ncbi:nuclear transport factor 2 family protein [Pseudidiomarina sp.]|uniref:nuclear transport factor 2 family protein n=1 Tax=Pseudidiomarina sp. TaxID=2081707 RepID=UPI003A979088